MTLLSLVKKITKRLTSLLQAIVYEQAHSWHLTREVKLSSEDSRFITLNQDYWKHSPLVEPTELILVEGFFAASGHNYLLRTGMLAKAIQEKSNLNIAVLFDRASHKQVAEKEKYKSFGINNFLYIKPGIRSLYYYFKAVILGLRYYRPLKSADDILKLNHDGILLGDLIYDDLLKSEKNKFTLDNIEPLLLKRLIQTLHYYYWYRYIFQSKHVKYLVTTHLVYAQYGVLARIALRYGAAVIETNDLMVNYLASVNINQKLISPTYHTVLKKKIAEYLQFYTNKHELIKAADDELNMRTSGGSEQFDARFAYRDKKKLSKQEFRNRLQLPENSLRPIVVIFAHVFADAPHSSDDLLFRDYYHWLEETLVFASKVKEVDWVVKPHPASKVYNEEGVVESLVEKAQQQSSHPNIYIYPDGVTSANLYDIADVIVTVQGTAGIEFSCLGLPVILAGKAFYAGEGFTYDPATREEYFSLLSNIAEIPRLVDSQIIRAKEIYAAFTHIMAVKSDIVSSHALDAIWGYGEHTQPDINLGNKIINDHLEKHDPKNELQYSRVKEYLG